MFRNIPHITIQLSITVNIIVRRLHCEQRKILEKLAFWEHINQENITLALWEFSVINHNYWEIAYTRNVITRLYCIKIMVIDGSDMSYSLSH